MQNAAPLKAPLQGPPKGRREGLWAKGPFTGFFVASQWVLTYMLIDTITL